MWGLKARNRLPAGVRDRLRWPGPAARPTVIPTRQNVCPAIPPVLHHPMHCCKAGVCDFSVFRNFDHLFLSQRQLSGVDIAHKVRSRPESVRPPLILFPERHRRCLSRLPRISDQPAQLASATASECVFSRCAFELRPHPQLLHLLNDVMCFPNQQRPISRENFAGLLRAAKEARAPLAHRRGSSPSARARRGVAERAGHR
jgi:hypothetical protein